MGEQDLQDDPTAELMEIANDFTFGVALDDIARTVGAEGRPTADEIVAAVFALRIERDLLRFERDALLDLIVRHDVLPGDETPSFWVAPHPIPPSILLTREKALERVERASKLPTGSFAGWLPVAAPVPSPDVSAPGRTEEDCR